MAARWYKNGSHDSWESTKCRGTADPREISARSPAQRTHVAEPGELCSLADALGCGHKSGSQASTLKDVLRLCETTNNSLRPARDEQNSATLVCYRTNEDAATATGKSLPTPRRTLLFPLGPRRPRRAEGTSHLTQVVFAPPNAARGARLHASDWQVTLR